MVRRIELPSSSELFDDPTPRPGRAADATAKEVHQAAVVPRPKRSRAKPPPRHGRQAARSPQTSPPLTRRMMQVEGRLGDLPIETLIDLRDGLESMLAGDAIDEKELAALLTLGG